LEKNLTFVLNNVDEIIGLDEAGMASYAGPVAVGAVAIDPLNPGFKWFEEVNDSKLLTPAKREQLFEAIRYSVPWAVRWATVTEIDQLGVFKARNVAMRRAYDAVVSVLDGRKAGAIVDGAALRKGAPVDEPALYVNKADQLSITVAAASIMAKVIRDRYMQKIAVQYPMYRDIFYNSKGYGTCKHKETLEIWGPTDQHRLSFRPVRNAFEHLKSVAGSGNFLLITGLDHGLAFSAGMR
jgi:ribonuclease HII